MARLPVDLMTLTDRANLPTGKMVVERATAADFGGQVGSAISGLAEAGSQLAMKIDANARKLREFDYERQFSQLQEQDNLAYETRMRGISGNADGHWITSREETQARFNAWLDRLPAQTRAEYAARAQQFQTRRTAQAFQDQFRQQDANTRVALTEEQRKAGLGVQQQPQNYETFLAEQERLIDSSPLTPLEKAQRRAEIRNSLAFTAEQARVQQNPNGYVASTMAPGLDGMKDLLRRKEGFREAPYWDVNAWRVGYGTDTITRADGTVVKVEPGMRVSREDAERDLDRRITDEFMPAAVNAVGREAWAKLSPAAQAVMVSLAYNYGAGAFNGPGERAGGRAGALNRVAVAAQTGDPQQLAAAVRSLAGHNNGVNAARRNAEADMVLSGRGAGGPAPASASALTAEQSAQLQERARRLAAAEQEQASAAREAELSARRNQTYIDLKEGANPEATYREARRTGVLSSFDDIQKAEGVMRAREQADSDFRTGLSLVEGGRVVANPYNKDHRNGVSALYDRGVRNGADPAALAASVFDRTGIVPPQFATALRGALVSEDPTRVGAALVAAGNMLRQNPNAFAGVEGGADLEKSAFEFNRLTQGLGRSTEEAANRIISDARNPALLDPVKQEQMREFRRTALTQEKIDSRLQSRFASGFFGFFGFGAPSLPTGPQRTALASIYSEFAEEGFQQFRDPNKAMEFADLRVRQQFGVQNGVLTRYPPARAGLPALPGASDGHAWINEQAAQIVKDRLGVVVDPSQIVLMPVERDGVSTSAAFRGQPSTVRRGDGPAEMETTFQSVPYMIQVIPKTAEQELLTVNGAFFPDIETYVAGKNRAIAAQNAGPPLVAYDQFGIPYNVPPHQGEMLRTPEQEARRIKAEQDAKLRASQDAERQRQEQERQMQQRTRERRRAGPMGEGPLGPRTGAEQ
jgi:GH24 family phage-related lysozyme (muramidase)